MTATTVPVISMTTAHRVWSAHREIEVASKLLKDLKDSLANGGDPTPIDAFGRRRNLSLGVPMSASNGERLFDVSPKLAVYIIEAHIADKQRELAEACVMAKMDMEPA